MSSRANRSVRSTRGALFAAVALIVVSTGGPQAQTGGVDVRQNNPTPVEQSAPVTPQRFDGDVRDLPKPASWRHGDPIKEIPRRYYPKPGMVEQRDPETSDRLVPQQLQQAGQDQGQDQTQGTGTFSTPSRSFNGIGFSGVNPPDPTGAIGPNHYIQSINGGGGALVRIFDKAESTPNIVADFAMDSLGSGSCGSGYGDPIVLYDRAADRFMPGRVLRRGQQQLRGGERGQAAGARRGRLRLTPTAIRNLRGTVRPFPKRRWAWLEQSRSRTSASRIPNHRWPTAPSSSTG